MWSRRVAIIRDMTTTLSSLPIDSILEAPPASTSAGVLLGTSRQDRDLFGFKVGSGRRSISLIAGCHADEPVGPAMLDRLTGYLLSLPASAPLVTDFTWYLVPHANPDGEARNADWTRPIFGDGCQPIAADAGVDPGLYLGHTVREPPGADVEFGFPRSPADDGARPENRAIADFLRGGGPFALHASFHGMSFAAGPWFLMEAAWIDRTAAMRESLRRRVGELGYRVHDIDRGGDKGFHRIDEGFTTRPDSVAMAAHFQALDDPATAALFRPSSMEYVRSLGGDPLTLVSEMPLFVVPPEHYLEGDVILPAVVRELSMEVDPDRIRELATARSIEPMPIGDQMRLQLEFLQAGLIAVCAASAPGE